MVLVGRIRGLDRAEIRQERHTAVGQPLHVGRARFTEVPQRLFRNRVLHLHRQIAVHVFYAVLDTGLFLNVGAAACVEDPSANRGGAASFEPIQNHDLGAALTRFDGGRDACGAQAYDDEICNVVPVRAVQVFDYDRAQAAHLDCAS